MPLLHVSNPFTFTRPFPQLDRPVDRRAQYFATSNIPSSSDPPDIQDNQPGILPCEQTFDSDQVEGYERTPGPDGGILDQFSWDNMLEGQPSRASEPPLFSPHIHPYIFPCKSSSPRGSGERTPLLRKAVSFSGPVHPRHLPGDAKILSELDSGQAYQTIEHLDSPLIRSNSFGSAKQVPRHNYGGKSTYSQTVSSPFHYLGHAVDRLFQLFNSIAILLGIGMLSEPLAFAYAGWIGGTILIIFYGFITCYT